MSGPLEAPAALTHGKESPSPTQSLSGGRFGEEKNIFSLPGFETRTVQTAACSLYQLRYSVR